MTELDMKNDTSKSDILVWGEVKWYGSDSKEKYRPFAARTVISLCFVMFDYIWDSSQVNYFDLRYIGSKLLVEI